MFPGIAFLTSIKEYEVGERLSKVTQNNTKPNHISWKSADSVETSVAF